METIAEVIGVVRARSGLSQRQLAERAGTSAAAISQYESGRRQPRLDTLRRIVEAAGASLDIEVRWPDPTALDLARNGRILEDLLDLGDHLPRRPKSDLATSPLTTRAG